MPVTISRREAFSFGLARKLLAHYEATPLHPDMRSVLDTIAEEPEGPYLLNKLGTISSFPRSAWERVTTQSVVTRGRSYYPLLVEKIRRPGYITD